MKTSLIDYSKVYEIWSPKDINSITPHRIEAVDGSHLVNMIFSSPEEAQQFIDKHNVPTK